MRAPVLRAVTAALSVAACGGSAEPASGVTTHVPHLTIVSGADAADTIGAQFQTPLLVEFRDSADRPVPGASILFVARLPGDSARLPQRALQVASSVTAVFDDSVLVTTDANGRAAATLRAGTIAGETRVNVQVVGQSLSTVASFTVLAGSVTKLVVDRLNVVTEVNGTGKFSAQAVDRGGNIAAAPTYSADSTAATIDADGTVHARATPGSFPVTVRAGSVADNRLSLSVVPVARVLVSRLVGAPFNGTIELALIGLDGQHVQSLVGPETNGVAGGSLTFFAASTARDGTVYYADLDSTGERIWVRTPPGARRRLTSSGSSTLFEAWPTLSTDGQWVYFTSATTSVAVTIWRIHPDGTGAEQIGPTNSPGPTAPSYSFLSVVPGGHALDLSLFDARQGRLSARFDLDARTVTSMFPFSTVGVVYSPVGDKFAYVLDNSSVIARTVATGKEVFFFSQFVHYDISTAPFSPDGKWIVLTNGALAIMNTDTGQIITCGDAQSRYAGAQWVQ